MNWIDTIVQGIMLGGLYALFAAGLSLVFGIMRLVNLAHGDLIVLSAYVILMIVTATGVNPFLAMVLAMPLMFVVGWALQTILLNKVVGKRILPPLLVTFGLSTVIQNGLLIGFSADSRRIPVDEIQAASITIGELNVGVLPLLTVVSAVIVMFVFNLILYRSELGREFRATSDDPVTAGLMGVRTGNIQAIAMGLALVIVTVGAFYLGMRASFDPSIGPARLTYAFEAVIIGGLGSIWGTFVGGLIIGVAQTIGAAIDPEWQIMAGHLAFLVILLFRPSGLFPRLGG